LTTIGGTIIANSIAIATGYRFEVTNGSNVRTYDSTTNSFNLNLLNGGALYGVTYSIRVAIQYNGIWRNYGTPCSVSAPAIPSTQIQDSQCGTTLATIGTTIYANNVTVATGYRFEVTSGTSVRTYDSSSRSFNLNALSGGALYGVTYSIRVAIKYNGTWQNYGASCNVSTPAIPITKVIDSQCGSVLPTTATTILANSVSIATGYRFEVTNGNTVRTYTSSTPGFKLTALSGGATLGVTYSIRVAIQYNGIWQNYGPSCNVTAGTTTSKVDSTQNNGIQTSIDKKQSNTLYALPNPFVDTFIIQKETQESKGLINISIYNNLGTLIKSIEVDDENLSTTQLGEDLPSGIYNVIVTQENSIQTMRVIKH
jgi:urease beta subunit